MISEDKKELRKRILAELNALEAPLRAELSAKIWAHLSLLEVFGEAAALFFYASFRHEVETYDMMRACLRLGKRVILPRLDLKTKEFELYAIKDCEDLEAGAYGILEPAAEAARAVNFSQVDLVLVPGVVFDRQGHRLGYGQGYYDRFLSHSDVRARKVGLAYGLQVVEKIPVDVHDVPMDWVVTETGIIDCGKQK